MNAISPHFSNHLFAIPLLYKDINYILLCKFFAIFAKCKFKTNFNYYQIEMLIWPIK